jgi:hypothetical protein
MKVFFCVASQQNWINLFIPIVRYMIHNLYEIFWKPQNHSFYIFQETSFLWNHRLYAGIYLHRPTWCLGIPDSKLRSIASYTNIYKIKEVPCLTNGCHLMYRFLHRLTYLCIWLEHVNGCPVIQDGRFGKLEYFPFLSCLTRVSLFTFVLVAIKLFMLYPTLLKWAERHSSGG